jgi:hypothetical protein
VAARRRNEGRPTRPPMRFATFSEINVYWVYEHELDALANGSSASLFLNFALFLLPISATLIVTLLTTTISSDRLFLGFLSVALITVLAGILLLLLWWRGHKGSGDLLRAIKDRMPPPAQPTSTEPESGGEAIRWCRRLLAQFEVGMITWNEFAYNIVLTLIYGCEDCMRAYVASIPVLIANQLFAHLQDFAVSVDFMPCPLPFIAGVASAEEVQRMKETLKPKYVQLYQAVRERT